VLSLRRRATGGNAGPRQAPPPLAEVADRRGRRRDPVWSPTTVQLHAALVAHGIPAALGSVEEGYPLAITLIGVDWRRVDVQIDEFPDGDPRGRAQRRAATRDQNLAELGWAVVRIPGWRAYLEPGGVAAEILDTATGTRGGAMGPDGPGAAGLEGPAAGRGTWTRSWQSAAPWPASSTWSSSPTANAWRSGNWPCWRSPLSTRRRHLAHPWPGGRVRPDRRHAPPGAGAPAPGADRAAARSLAEAEFTGAVDLAVQGRTFQIGVDGVSSVTDPL
jgi:hypothetical protein